MAITMIFVSVLLLLMVNLYTFSKQVEDSVQIQVFLDSTTTSEEITAVKQQIVILDNVDKVTFVSRDKALKQLIQQYGSAFELLEGDTNPLYDKFEVQVADKEQIKQTAKKLQQLPSVFQARYGSESADTLLSSMRTVRRFGLILTVVALLVTMVVLFFTLMMSIKSRQEEIQTRILIGATPGYIRRPFIIQSMLLTMSGGGLAIVLSVLGYAWFFARFNPSILNSGYQLCTVLQAGLPVAGVILIVSFFFGWLGATIAVHSSIDYPK